jgi:pentatricopeptide repeat domain-containing protein 2
LDSYSKTRDRTKIQFVNLADKFKTKMVEFSDPSSTNMIFTEDLKNMIHLSEATSDDLDLVYKMMKRCVKTSPIILKKRQQTTEMDPCGIHVNYL